MAEVQRLGVNAQQGSYFTFNRSWSTALGRPYTTTRLRPDIIYVEHLGNGTYRIHAIEVASPGQNPLPLLQKLQNGWNTLVSHVSLVTQPVLRVI